MIFDKKGNIFMINDCRNIIVENVIKRQIRNMVAKIV